MGDRRRRVLFLCTGNSARSQMAQAYLNKLAGDQFDAYSAGMAPKGVHPLTVKVLAEDGIDISDSTSNDIKEYFGHVTFLDLVSVCDEADKACPTVFPGVQRRYHWSFQDPAAAEGSEEEQLAVFRKIRDQIKERITKWLDNQELGLRK